MNQEERLPKICALRVKMYAYLLDDDSEKKKAKETKKYVIKISLKTITDCLFNDKVILKSQQRFKSDHHDVYTEQINKIALSSTDGKRLQTIDKLQRIHVKQMLLKYAQVECY